MLATVILIKTDEETGAKCLVQDSLLIRWSPVYVLKEIPLAFNMYFCLCSHMKDHPGTRQHSQTWEKLRAYSSFLHPPLKPVSIAF